MNQDKDTSRALLKQKVDAAILAGRAARTQSCSLPWYIMSSG